MLALQKKVGVMKLLNLLYITNHVETAKIADHAGVDRIFIDLETLGKQERQKNIDSVKSQHVIEDIPIIKSSIDTAKLLVRVNPINKGSAEEINRVIDNGADIVMLPMFQTVREVELFLRMVDTRARTCLLLETDDAVRNIDEITALSGIDEMHIGLNDLTLSKGLAFLFEPLSDGTVERLMEKAHYHGIPCGFGGVANLGAGDLPAEAILTEHYRLKSSSVILSRQFCEYARNDPDKQYFAREFSLRVQEIRAFERKLETYSEEQFAKNRSFVANTVQAIAQRIRGKKEGHDTL